MDNDANTEQVNVDELWCEICYKREAHAHLDVVWTMDMGGENTDAEFIACCRRCSAVVLNAWDDMVQRLRES